MKTTTKQIETPSAPAEKSAQRSEIAPYGTKLVDGKLIQNKPGSREAFEHRRKAIERGEILPENAAQHSPLPWTNHDDDYPSEKRFTIKSPWTETHKPGDAEGYGDYRGLTVCIIEHQGDGAPVVTKRQAKANAAFIVEACNNYERVKAERDQAWATSNRHLIERNQRIEQVRELLAALRWIVGDDDSDEPAIVNAKAAISKAEKSAK